MQVRHSLLGTHTWYQQTYNGVPVYHGWYAKHVLRSGTFTDDGRRAVSGLASTKAAVSSASAVSAAKGAGVHGSKGTLMVLAGRARAAWSGSSTAPTRQALVDASSGKVASVVADRRLRHRPRHGCSTRTRSSALQNENLKDQNDSNTAVPNARVHDRHAAAPASARAPR